MSFFLGSWEMDRSAIRKLNLFSYFHFAKSKASNEPRKKDTHSLRVRYKAILDEPKGKHECFHLQFSKHLLTFFSYLKYVLTNLTFFCCEYSKESFCIFEKS